MSPEKGKRKGEKSNGSFRSIPRIPIGRKWAWLGWCRECAVAHGEGFFFHCARGKIVVLDILGRLFVAEKSKVLTSKCRVAAERKKPCLVKVSKVN